MNNGMELSYLAMVLCNFLLRRIDYCPWSFACVLEFVNVFVGVHFPEHLNFKGGGQVLEFNSA